MNTIKDSRGFTLIELLVSLAILSIVMMMTVNLFKYSSDAYNHDDTNWQVQQYARDAMDKITSNVRSAAALKLMHYNMSSNSFSYPAALSDNALYLDAAGGTKIYLKNSTLYLAQSGGTPNPFAYNIDSILFDFSGGANNIKVSVTVSRKIPGTNSSAVYTLVSQLYSRLLN